MKKEPDFTQKQFEAMRQIRNWLTRYGRTPSVRELMSALGYKSPKSVQDILGQLEAKRVIRKRESGEYRFIKDSGFGSAHAQTVNVPLVGTVTSLTGVLR